MAGSSLADTPAEISKDEVELYDRQIRLWGLDAQNMLRVSSVFVYGLSGLGAEVVKNLMLCGLKSMTIADGVTASENDRMSNFFLDAESIGTNRASASAAKAQALNPNVKLSVLEKTIDELEITDIRGFDMVIFNDLPYPVVDKWNTICRKEKLRFVAGSVYGWTGYCFLDFNSHRFLIKQPKNFSVVGLDNAPSDRIIDTIDEDIYEKQTVSYPSFSEAFNVPWTAKTFIRKAKRMVPTSYAPIRAHLRAEETNAFTGVEEEDVKILVNLFKKEVEEVNHTTDMYVVPEEDFDYYMNPQLSSVCAIVGGIIGQEAIKALSEGQGPLRNVFIYSALISTGHMVLFPPQ